MVKLNVRAVKNTLQLHENVVQNYIAIGIFSSAATLKVVMEGLYLPLNYNILNLN